MANPLFDMFGKNQTQNNAIMQFINEVRNVQNTFNGDPKTEVEKMIKSGQLSQNDFNKYAQMANQIMAFMPKK